MVNFFVYFFVRHHKNNLLLRGELLILDKTPRAKGNGQLLKRVLRHEREKERGKQKKERIQQVI